MGARKIKKCRRKFCCGVAAALRRRGGVALLAFSKNFDKMNLRNVADPSFKKGSRIFKQRAPNVTCSELTAPRGEYAALRRAKSAFDFGVRAERTEKVAPFGVIFCLRHFFRFFQGQNETPQGFEPILSLLPKIPQTFLQLRFLAQESVFLSEV